MASDTGQGRDYRLDFFRGLALFMIYIDHIPDNVLSHFTVRVIGFSDAAEIFIFISGYVAAVAYGRAMARQGFFLTSAQVFRRVWQLYVAHLTLFMIYMAEVSFALSRLGNPLLKDDLSVGGFLTEPHIAIVKALTLQFQPKFLDILPLYISLLMVFPLVLLAFRKHVALAIMPSLALYLATRFTNIEFPAYPQDSEWFFNPLAWQFLFVIGAACGHTATTQGKRVFPAGRWPMILAGSIALVCGLIHLDWEIHSVWSNFPGLLGGLLWPYIDKTNLAALRLVNFLALVMIAVKLVPRDSKILTHKWAQLIIVCGQKSLYVFCLSILLSAFFLMLQVEFEPTIPAQLLYSVVGISLMLGLALVMNWYDTSLRRLARKEAKP